MRALPHLRCHALFYKVFQVLGPVAALIVLACSSPATAADVILTEIHYHPTQPSNGPEPVREEFLELHNRSSNPVTLEGWKLEGGVDHVFGNVELPAGGYAVFVADPIAFRAAYPFAPSPIGTWTGRLSNDGEELRLVDAQGRLVERVKYSKGGDWTSVRRTSQTGMQWDSKHDGGGSSLERVDLEQPGDSGLNWSASLFAGGTPGEPNSAAASPSGPLISGVLHHPPVPRSSQEVLIQAEVRDSNPGLVQSWVFFRNATTLSPAAFVGIRMWDDGRHEDEQPGDGIFAAKIPAQTNGTVVEFFIMATNGLALNRSWPPPILDNGQLRQSANALYVVDDSVSESSQPIYRVIATQTERSTIMQSGPFRYENAPAHVTFISVEPAGVQVRYRCGIRIRGASSRGNAVPNYRVNFPDDAPWNGKTEINLNAWYSFLQHLGGKLAQLVGVAAEETRLVRFRINTTDPTEHGPGSPNMGAYVLVEPLNGEWAAKHFPDDPDGNVYRCAGHSATLAPLPDKQTALSRGYSKTSNQSLDDWTDLFSLTSVLITSNSPAYFSTLSRQVNVEAWMRYFAFMQVVTSLETSLATGAADDYALYRGVKDPRFHVMVHDLDSTFGLSGSSSLESRSLFYMLESPRADMPWMHNFLRLNSQARLYLSEVLRQLDGVFANEPFESLAQRELVNWVDPATIRAIIDFQRRRNTAIRAQIPLKLAITSPAPPANGAPVVFSTSTLNLAGTAHAIQTHRVEVNGLPATWTAYNGAWRIDRLPLQGGRNRIVVQTFGPANEILDSTFLEVEHSAAPGTLQPENLVSDTVWRATNSPFHIQSTLLVASNATLTIEPGAVVVFGTNGSLQVDGKLNALGTGSRRIRMLALAPRALRGDLISLNSRGQLNSLSGVDFDGGSEAASWIQSRDAQLIVADCSWTVPYGNTLIGLSNSAARIQDCRIPAGDGIARFVDCSAIPEGYSVTIQSNRIEGTSGSDPLIHFRGATGRQGQGMIIGNEIAEATAGIVQFDGVDGLVEGNWMKSVRKRNPGSAEPVAAIRCGSGPSSVAAVWVLRNVFHDVEQAVSCAKGAAAAVIHNTIVGVSGSALWLTPDAPGEPGTVVRFEGNIVANPSGWNGVVILPAPAQWLAMSIHVRGNLLPAGSGLTENIEGDPRFRSTSPADLNSKGFRTALQLTSDSPALGQGVGGVDLGAFAAEGAVISGEPPSPTRSSNAILAVTGVLIDFYRYRIDQGDWSEPIPSNIPLTLTALAPGPHQVSVVGQDQLGRWQSLDKPTISRTWVVNPDATPVRIHEVLTANVVSAPVEGRFVDWIELQSMSSTPFSLAGWGITDDPARPFRYKFPPGTMMASGALRVWLAENELLSPTSLGFALDRDGSGVYLFDPGTNLMDSVVFGSQLEDLSIGRNNSGAWVLCTPTPFGTNRPAITSSPSEVVLNEWQVNGPLLSSFDFIELYNAGRHPVNLGGMHLTDELFGTPRRHRIADLTFIAPGGFSLFLASGRPERGVAHLDFRLAAEQGMIALTDEAGQTVDSVVYGPQRANHSEGRIGGVKSTQSVFTQTTPGVPNAGPIVTGPGFTTQTLFPLVTSWLFAEGVSDFPTGWTLPGADVSAFRSGSAVFVDPFSTDLFSNFGTRFASWGDAGSKIFRKTFVVTNLPPNGRLLARGYIDDGAIFYLNGGYAGSVRMPPLEQVLSTTRALSSPLVRTAQETVELDASLLRVGTNVLAVQLHQTANDSLRAAFGVHLELTAPVIREPVRNLRLNEVLAANSYIKNGADRTPDWVEIINATTNDVDLAGMSLTDDLSQPRKWVFPSGVRLSMGAVIRIECDSGAAPSLIAGPALNTGFGLNDRGDDVFLFDAPARGGAVLDSVAFGMQAADFSIARIPDASGNWTLGLPTLQEPGTNQPALLGLAESLRFNEWMANPLGTDDWFELFNTSGRPVDLSGLFLSDDATQPSKYRIPALSYLGSSTNGYLRFWADNDSPQGPTHVNFRLNDSGETLVLSQTDLTSLLKVTFGPQARGISEGLLPDGDTTIVRQFGGSGSPGARNFLPLPSLRVLEVIPSNPGDTGGALEIQNLGETETSLEGWWLTDDERRIRKYQFTSAAKIPAQSVLVLQLAEINANLPPALHLRLDRMEGGQVMLLESDSTGTLTGFQVSAEFGPLPSGVSVGWQLTAGGPQHAPLQHVTLGSTASNAPVRTGPVIISEVHYHPPDLAGTDNSRDEFVELHNVSSTSVILRSTGGDAHIWRLRDAVDYEFPSGTTLQPGQFALVVSFDPQTNGVTTAAFRQRLGVPASTTLFGPFVGKLDNSSDSIELARRLTEDAGPNEDPKATPETVADRVRYRDVFPWPSLADGGEQGRGYSLQKNPVSGFGNDAATWVAAEPTPGRPGNSSPTGLPQVTQQPQTQTVLQGLQTTLSVTVNSNGPLSYQWFHNGLPILQGTNRELARVFALDSDAGEYQVLVGNRLGSVFSAGAKIILGRSPAIKASPKDQFVATGSQASFTVEATGGTPLAYQWFRNDVALSTATDRTLVIAAASAQDEGRYRVRISNPFGEITSSEVSLRTGAGPVISVQSTALVVLEDRAFRLEASNPSSDPWSGIQWFFNSVPIPGATNLSFDVPRTPRWRAGLYWAVVSNLFGETTSPEQRVHVMPLPVVTVVRESAVVSETPGALARFSVRRSYATNAPLEVHYRTGGQAQNGLDYQRLAGRILIPPDRATVLLEAGILDDPWVEGSETIEVRLSPGSNYVLGTNIAAAIAIQNSDVPPGSTETATNRVMAFTHAWKYQESEGYSNTSWTLSTFPDSTWPMGGAPFFREADPLPVPGVTSLADLGITSYFRTTIHVPDRPVSQVWIQGLVDDGWVLYVNGRRTLISGISSSLPLNSGLRANRSIDNATIEGPTQIQVPNLVVGTNWIAVELHQFEVPREDAVFALQMELTYGSDIPPVLGDPILNADGRCSVVLGGQGMRRYDIETSTDLIQWEVWTQVVFATNEQVRRIEGRFDPGHLPRFFRARVLPPR